MSACGRCFFVNKVCVIWLILSSNLKGGGWSWRMMKECKDWREGEGKSERTKQCTGMWRVNCSGLSQRHKLKQLVVDGFL